MEVLRRALEITEKEFGPFTLEVIDIVLSSNREVKVVEEGDILNVTITPANAYWDARITPIKVPIRLGLLSYRLLLINKAGIDNFKGVDNLNELNELHAGLLNHWKTTGIFKAHNLSRIETLDFESLFLMLSKARFDYIPRGVYEAYDEIAAHQPEIDNIMIEPNLALFLPTITYVYVSPKTPKIAKRLKAGLHKLLSSGELKKILHKYYAKDIKRSNIKQRTIIEIENPYYNELNIQPAWFE